MNDQLHRLTEMLQAAAGNPPKITPIRVRNMPKVDSRGNRRFVKRGNQVPVDQARAELLAQARKQLTR